MIRHILLALLLIPLVAASGIMLDEKEILACATDQLVISGKIENSKAMPDLYRLSVDSAEGISAYVTEEIEVAAYGREGFRLFLSPICLPTGTYGFKVIAEGVRGERMEENGKIEVRDCNLMELRVAQDKAEACNGESASFSIFVRNLGREEQDFSLGTDLEKSGYVLSKSRFSLKPGQEASATLTLNVPADLYQQGMLTFKIKAQSTYSCGSNSRESLASIKINRCDGITLTALKQIAVQGGTQEKWNIFLDNQKTEDTYDLKLVCPSFAQFSQKTLQLGSFQGASLDVILKPRVEDVGEYDCTLTATSQKFKKGYGASAKIKVVQNYGAKLALPSEIRVCEGEIGEVKAKLQNTGEKNEYHIGASGVEGKLSSKTILAPLSSTNDFSFFTSDKLGVGKYTLEISAASPYVAIKQQTSVIVESCFASSLRLPSGTLGMCAGEGTTLAVKAANRGTQEDSYVLSVKSPGGIVTEFKEQAFRLKSAESRELGMNLRVEDSVAPGKYELQIRSDGKRSAETATLELEVLPIGICHALKLESDGTSKRTGSGVGKSFRIQVINEGRFTEKVELFLSQKPAWAYITPAKLEILPGKKEEALIYFAPPLNQKLGDYPLVVEVRGKYLTKNLELKVQVVALETGEEIRMDLSQAKIPRIIEKDVETPMKIRVRNTGETDLQRAAILFSEAITVLEQVPFELKAGETKDVHIVVKLEDVAEDRKKVMMGIYAQEGFSEKEVEFEVAENPLELEQVSMEKVGEKITTVLKLANHGNVTLNLTPKSLGGAEFQEHPLSVPANGEIEFEANFSEGNETIYFEDAATGKVYRRRITVGKEGDITGLFVASFSKVAPLLIAIIGGAIALYLIISRKDKIMRRFDGKKDSDIDGDENGIYEEPAETEEAGEDLSGANEAVTETKTSAEDEGTWDTESDEKIADAAIAAQKERKYAKKKSVKKIKPRKRKSGLRGQNLFVWFGK